MRPQRAAPRPPRRPTAPAPAPRRQPAEPPAAAAAGASSGAPPPASRRRAAADGGDRDQGEPARQAARRGEGHRPCGVTGSGPGGRIVKADVEAPAGGARARQPPAPAAADARPAAAAPALVETEHPARAVKLSNMRKTIARRLTESKQTGPAHLSHRRHPARRAAQAARRAQQGARGARREAQGQRPADQGARRRADRGARVQRHLRRRQSCSSTAAPTSRSRCRSPAG